ncbi:Shedu anti-phage system protein SduA domain-containing protein [Pseudomonas sp. RT4P38]
MLSDWTNLLADKSQLELAYQTFLKRHAGMFFPSMPLHDEIILSGLKLGADHEVDFVMAHSERSLGFIYTLIEIETPHDTAFTKAGDPRARLSHAIQQTNDWKSWLEENRDQVQRLFPSKRLRVTGKTHFRYMVIMGRRSDEFNERRNVWSEKTGVQIRSFDWFTDNLLNKQFHSFNSYTSDIIKPSYEEDNQFTNPFAVAYTDADWRKIVDDPRLTLSHMVGHNLEILAKHRSYNRDRWIPFIDYINSLPGSLLFPSEREYWRMSHRC